MHIGTLEEIDRRLRERKILIEGYRIDPIKGYVAVKIDVLRNIRPPDEVKRLADKGSTWLLEEVFAGLPGYVVVTDAQLRIEDFGYKGAIYQDGEQEEERANGRISIQCTMHIEHTYVMKDGKYLCEWGDAANPIHKPETLFEKRPVTREIEQRDGMQMIRYNL